MDCNSHSQNVALKPCELLLFLLHSFLPMEMRRSVGEWFVLRQGTLKKVRTLGARERLATLLERPGETPRETQQWGHREFFPRFRPPCGVIPYSCLSDGLHCVSYSTRRELVLKTRPRREVAVCVLVLLREAMDLLLQPPGSPSLLIRWEGKPHWPCVWRPNTVFILHGLGPQGTTPPSLAA